MKNINWRAAIAWLLAAFFVLGGVMNIFVSPQAVADYERWGYPAWFHYVTGTLELTAAALLIRKKTRFLGAMLASLVMIAAATTVLSNGEISHALAPLIVLAVSIVVAWLNRSFIRRPNEGRPA